MRGSGWRVCDRFAGVGMPADRVAGWLESLVTEGFGRDFGKVNRVKKDVQIKLSQVSQPLDFGEFDTARATFRLIVGKSCDTCDRRNFRHLTPTIDASVLSSTINRPEFPRAVCELLKGEVQAEAEAQPADHSEGQNSFTKHAVSFNRRSSAWSAPTPSTRLGGQR